MSKNIINKKMKKNDEKCAPHIKYNERSCFSHEQLIKIANAYNEHIKNNKKNDYIVIENQSKKQLVLSITGKLKGICDDQICWLKQDFIKKMVNDDLLNNVFRPKGPSGTKWLNTTNINDIMKQYEQKYKDYIFFGAVPIDFDNPSVSIIKNINYDDLYSDGIHKIGFVFNLDEHWQNGSHWCALYCNIHHEKNQIFFFDSYGTKPNKRIMRLMNRISKWCYANNKKIFGGSNDINNSLNKIDDYNIDTETFNELLGGKKKFFLKKLDIRHNKIRHQFKGSECGVYSVNFILRLLNGETFEYITENITLDDKVNECRDEYFRFE